MFKTKIRAKQIENICKSSIIRNANKVYKNKLYINNEIYQIETIKIKNNIQFINELAPIQNWLNNRIYLLERKSKISTHMFKSNVDIIVCDSRFNIISLHKNVKKNSNIDTNKLGFNIWIAKVGFIDFYYLKINDYIALKPLSL